MRTKIMPLMLALALSLALPAVLTAQTVYLLYDASDGDRPEDDGYLYFQAQSLFGSQPTVQTGSNATGNYVAVNTLNDNGIAAGYTSVAVTITSVFPPSYITGTKFSPVLDANKGIELSFTSEILNETHTSMDRAGFSTLLLDKNARGIEIAFWEDQIWAQNANFTQGESVSFDTTTAVSYTLQISGTQYTLTADSTPILSGTTRVYLNDISNPAEDVYDFANFIFLGDNTTSGAANFRLYGITLVQDSLGGTLNATALLQGRGDSSGALDVQLYDIAENTSTPAYSLTVTSNASGTFSLPDIAAGTYTVAVKHPLSLRAVQTASFTSTAVTTLDFGTLLMGDANNDNQVNILDLSILAGAYNTSVGDTDYNPQANFNGDTAVNILDLSLLAGNYNTAGADPLDAQNN